jgi:cobalt-precorrin-5B (C1)-methyltransferase
LSARILAANNAAEAFLLARTKGIALGDEVARAAKVTAERVVAGRDIAIEIVLFDRDAVLVGRAPFDTA